MLSDMQAQQRPRQKNSRKAILDAAEHAFADFGFGGASIRAIARNAGVNQAMIHYYYRNKEQLFSAVMERRSGDINGRRHAALDTLFDGKTPTLEELVEAILRPTIELGHDQKRGGADYARLIVYLNNSADRLSQGLVEEYYNPVARRSIDAIMKVLPDIGHAGAVRGYLFAISVALSVMARTGRAARLSDGLCDDGNTEETVSMVVAFACAGIRALVSVREK